MKITNLYMSNKALFTNLFGLIMLMSCSVASAEAPSGGEVIGRNIFGLATDFKGAPAMQAERPIIYDVVNASTTLDIKGEQYLVSVFDHTIGGVYITALDPETMNPIDTEPLNMSAVGGVSSPKSGGMTPWNSLLLLESRLVDSTQPQVFKDEFKPYFAGKEDLVNLYNYGWVSEIIVLGGGYSAKAIKNYAVGRVFASDLILMPDGKTIYMNDANSSDGLFVFVAEQANSLSKGTLYSVGLENNRAVYSKLGSTSSLKMKFKLKKITFNRVFDIAEPAAGTCKRKYTYIHTVYGEECLKIKKKMKKYAGLFEPIRVAAIKGYARIPGKLSSLSFDLKQKQLELEIDGKKLKFSLGGNGQMNSQYLMQESL